MSRQAPTKGDEDEFWLILRASASLWPASHLGNLLAYHLRAPELAQSDAASAIDKGFAAFSGSGPRERSELLASVSHCAEYKAAKKALGIRRPKARPATSRPRIPKPAPSPAELSAFWALLESSAGSWGAPAELDNLLAYHLRQPISGCQSAQGVIGFHEQSFLAAPAQRQREAMASLSSGPPVKAAIKAARKAHGGPRPPRA